MSDDTSQNDEVRWREPLGAFAIVVGALLAASLLSWVWGAFANYLLAVAAIIFIATPWIILNKQGADLHRFGIDLERIPLKHVGMGLLVTAVVFPLFAVGNHLWERTALEREFEFDLDNYRQWQVELEAPSLLGDHRQLIQVRTFANRLHLEWAERGDPEISILAEADRPFRWSLSGDLGALPAERAWFDEPQAAPSAPRARGADLTPSHRWLLAPSGPDATGRLTISALEQLGPAEVPNRLELRLVIPPDVEAPPVFVGGAPHSAQESIELRRTHWWLLLWALTHLLLVALPEEYFYRGYLQTRFADLFGDQEEPKTFLGFSRANWLTSGCFALGHVLIPIGGAFSLMRASVFFPSLIFGWLRERTGSIIAPTVFHAAANMMVLIVGVHYF